ncbi:MAG: hypothetical protein IID46_16190 [Planctomycetes bacterium]|nr:hypothetical protein [Planctomycetota bacterium]
MDPHQTKLRPLRHQTETATVKAVYCLAVKQNQPALYGDIDNIFRDHIEDDFARTEVRRHQIEEKGHGREEICDYSICPAPEDLLDRSRWVPLKAIGVTINFVERDG